MALADASGFLVFFFQFFVCFFSIFQLVFSFSSGPLIGACQKNNFRLIMIFMFVERGSSVKKKVAALLLLAVLVTSAGPAMAINNQRGGLVGFVAGCCFGIRSGAAYNDGKEIHWRELGMVIPIANIVFAIWNGIDGASGMTTKDYAAKYGRSYY